MKWDVALGKVLAVRARRTWYMKQHDKGTVEDINKACLCYEPDSILCVLFFFRIFFRFLDCSFFSNLAFNLRLVEAPPSFEPRLKTKFRNVTKEPILLTFQKDRWKRRDNACLFDFLKPPRSLSLTISHHASHHQNSTYLPTNVYQPHPSYH